MANTIWLQKQLSESQAENQRFRERNQQLRERVAELERDQRDWRKGVELIASVLGESNPPDLFCGRLAEMVLKLRADSERLEKKVIELVPYVIATISEVRFTRGEEWTRIHSGRAWSSLRQLEHLEAIARHRAQAQGGGQE